MNPGSLQRNTRPHYPCSRASRSILQWSARRCGSCIARGDYADIRVTAEPSAEGLRVNFIVRRNYFNNVIRV